jgi:hypothetical protein
MTNKERLQDILEEFYNFKEYEILENKEFGQNDERGIHHLVNVEDMWYEVDQCLAKFYKDGYNKIFFYIEEESDCDVIDFMEYRNKVGA